MGEKRYAVIQPAPLAGTIPAIASKSVAHRMLILSALCEGRLDLDCETTSRDIEATADCMRALGARVARTSRGFRVNPLPRDGGTPRPTEGATLDCGESGSTIRFLLPVVAALGGACSLTGHGRLAQRPLSPLFEELVAHGARLSSQGAFPLRVQGPISGGTYRLPGDVSSQFVSGLLMAAPLVLGGLDVEVTEPMQSRSYVAITVSSLAKFGVHVSVEREAHGNAAVTRYSVPAGSELVSPGVASVEGDWSNAAFWLAAGASCGEGVTVTGLDLSSSQGDRAVLGALASFGAHVTRGGDSARCTHDALRGRTVDVADIPDLVPPLAAVAATAKGTTRFTNAGRLRLKESDRLVTVRDGLNALGANVSIDGDELVVEGVSRLTGGEVDARNDHRIAMMAAVAAAGASGPTTIHDSGCVSKSYPAFFADFAALGGNVTEGWE